MKLEICGDINAFYVQTLCLLYFPGSKFSEKNNRIDDGITVRVDYSDTDDAYTAKVSIDKDGSICEGSFSLSKDEVLSRPSMASKIAVGKAFLEAGKKMTGFVPPWGILTGVRPSKLSISNIDAGMSTEDAALTMEREYSVTKDKAYLAAQVASAESRIIKRDLYGKCSIYIAVPFCPSRCSYCSFVSFTSEKLLSLIPEYLDVLIREVKRTGDLVKRLGIKVSTVYIGGGTPTVLDEDQLERLLAAVEDSFDVSSLDEYTLEAGRPDTITAEKMISAKRHGVTRVSVNTQTLSDEILRSIGRNHTSDDFFRAFETARKSGIDNINVDLIAGLPKESFESFKASLDGVTALRPENITVHTFCVKRSADIRWDNVYSPENIIAARSVSYSNSAVINSGYIPYYMYRQKNAMSNLENVGYTLPGHEGLYNIFMMEEIQSIFAVGASAVSKLVHVSDIDGKVTMQRLFENKYPYEYLREKNGSDAGEKIAEFEKAVFDFYKVHFGKDF